MTWLKVDDGFAEHDKVFGLSDRAFRIHVTALCYSARHLTDGRIDDRALKVVAITAKVARTNGYVTELVEARLWEPADDGHVIRDYLDYNPSAAEVKEERRKAKERMAERRRRSRGRSGKRSGERS